MHTERTMEQPKPADDADQEQQIKQRRDRPNPAWVVGACPECGDALVDTPYYGER